MGPNNCTGAGYNYMYIRIFSYVKNEKIFIDKWLNHHAKISKWYMLHVVDNMSNDGTWEILQHYKKTKGINIYRHDDYSQKGVYLSSLIKRYDKQDSIAIPIDGDEFICLKKPTGELTNNTGKIRDYISNLDTSGHMYSTHGTLFTVPTKPYNKDPFTEITRWKWHWDTPSTSKKFYNTKTFKKTDHGNHNGISDNKNYKSTDLVYLHYHDIGRDHYKQKCEQDVASLNLNIKDFAEPNNTGIGCEKARALLNIGDWDYSNNREFDIKFKWTNGNNLTS